MKILVTAFKAFGGESVNPAEEALKLIKDEDVIKLVLPVEYEKASLLALYAIDRYAPSGVINVGQAGGRDAVTPEKYAVNLRSASVSDAAGRVCAGEKIAPNGTDRLESTFDAEALSDKLNRAGIPSRVSESAGTYVCNDVMYSVLSRLKGAGVPAGFIHVPYCTEQAASHPDKFALDINEIARALKIAVEHIKQISIS